jgi:type II secretory pathway pseudopilin PulG
MLTRKICEKQNAFSLVEVIVAMLILFIVSLAVAFVIAWAAKLSVANRTQLVATKLATNIIEEIKACQYNDVGFTDSTPHGVFVRTLNADNITYSYSPTVLPAAQVVDINRVTYKPQINIWWQIAPGVLSTEGVVHFPTDYKLIDVTVTATSDGTGSQMQSVDMKGDISFEGGAQAVPGGNLNITAYQAPNSSNTLEGIYLSLLDGPTGMSQINTSTDETGMALFASSPGYQVATGGYVLHSYIPGVTTWMIQPDWVDQNFNLPNLLITSGSVPVNNPCTLTITLQDTSGNPLPSNTRGTIILTTPWNAGSVPILFNANPFQLTLWPVGNDASTEKTGSYSFQVIANATGGNSYLPYTLNETDPYNSSSLWNGQFSEPGTSQNLTVKLIKACTVVTVNDAGSGAPITGWSGAPITGARVEIDWQKRTYNSGSWGAWQTVVQNVCNTDPMGQALFSDLTNGQDPPLGQHESYTPPPSPGPGSTYYQFALSASVQDSNLSDMPNNQFYPMPSAPATYGPFPAAPAPVQLTPATYDIRIRPEYASGYSQGYPRWNVTIEALGPVTTYGTVTPGNGPANGLSGQVVFNSGNGVPQGTYTLSYQNGSVSTVIDTPGGQPTWPINLGDYQVIASW